jgi:7-cyano-7-deazaguanine synthase
MKALVLLSGGQDSTTCLYWAIRQYGMGNVFAIGFDYNQRHADELKYAQAICDDLGISFIILPLPAVSVLTENALTRTDIQVDTLTNNDNPTNNNNSTNNTPANNNTQTNNNQTNNNNPMNNNIQSNTTTPPNTLVEGRNLLFLTYAAIYAKTLDIRVLVTGVSQTDFSGYPDCRDIFIKSTNITLNLGMDYPYIIETPLMWLTKTQVWALALELGILDIIKEKTLTCYNGISGEGCGNCPACRLRKKGYDEFMHDSLK